MTIAMHRVAKQNPVNRRHWARLRFNAMETDGAGSRDLGRRNTACFQGPVTRPPVQSAFAAISGSAVASLRFADFSGGIEVLRFPQREQILI
jgi:hypothetical protein